MCHPSLEITHCRFEAIIFDTEVVKYNIYNTLLRKIAAYCLKTLKKPVHLNFKLCIMKNEITLG
jgi:hypothetical protein